MGKVSPVGAKYVIQAGIEIEGSVDRPDVIGAIFGQTEGLLGTELELRELQRSGKIGRIEVKLESKNGKSQGTISIPSNLDQAETAVIAAALETIERIGPCNSKVNIKSLDDVRITKRDFVINRAKELLGEFQHEVMPDSQEITAEVTKSVRMMEITSWGKDKLPAGPGLQESDDVILVEGRADVLTLLKHGIKNTVALNGTSIPASIKNLCKQKTVTVFVDGDRGGNLIIRELMLIAEVDFIAKAPDGKEVEELTKKEIHLALRAKVTAAQYKKDEGTNGSSRQKSSRERTPQKRSRENTRQPRRDTRSAPRRTSESAQTKLKTGDMQVFKKMLDDLVGTRGACIIDAQHNVLGKVPTAELQATLNDVEGAHAVIFDGEVTRDLVQAAQRCKVDVLVGMTSKARSGKVKVLTQKDF